MYYLVAHVVVTAAAFVWLYVRHAETYRRFRNVMVVITLTGMVGLLVKLPVGWLGQRCPLNTMQAIGLFLLSGGLLWLPHIYSAWALTAYGVIMGISGTITTVLFFAVWGQAFGRAHLGQIQAIAQMLTRIGAHASVLSWEERRVRREVRATANRLANFDDANLRRSARAAVAAAARVTRALEILADDAPNHLTSAGRLRLEHRQASLEELGALADPPLTKDAIAGRIRRLLALADKRARDLGVPDTEAAVTPEMLAS